MHVSASDPDSVSIAVSRSELGLINNALNEVCNGVIDLDNDDEFSTRLGHTRGEARQLLAEVQAALRG